MTHDFGQIKQAIELIARPAWDRGDVVELRALNTSKGVVSGYFDAEHATEMVEAAAQLSGKAQGVYITLNSVLSDCVARAANRCIFYAKNTTGDKEVTHRHWLLIDFDPARPSGVSATDDEHERALKRAHDVRDWLTGQDWPTAVYADSGNGAHLLYRVDLPSEDDGLLKSVLKALADQFSDELVDVDRGVHNSARISKLYGTLSCKGDNVPERPHRVARILEVPDVPEVVSSELLESLKPATSTASPASFDVGSQSFNVVEYLAAHGMGVGRKKDCGDHLLWELEYCPWRPSECDGGAYVKQYHDGRVYAGCHHVKCEGKGWDDLRDILEPGWRDKKSDKKQPLTQQIVDTASGDELFHTAEDVAYATVECDGHRETHAVKGKTYNLLLRKRMHERGVPANRNSLEDATATLESNALFDGTEQQVHVRVAGYDDKIYIDLCNDSWEVVEISTEGWNVVENAPIKFVRHPGMLPLPTPTRGGDINELRDYINVTDADWFLVVAWLMGALRPSGPYPILLVNGEQGSCKSTTCRRLRSLIDPNTVPLRDAPKDEQTLMIAASKSHVIALDNLSSVRQWLSNAMCRLATGGGHSQRALYSDDGEKLFHAVRPQMLNGIGEIATRSDLLNRGLPVCLPTIDPSRRKTEKELDAAFEEVYPSILGAMFTAAATGLKKLPEVERLQIDLPRMADFARWMMAVETALGWEEGTIKAAMNANAGEAHELVLASSPVGEAIRGLLKKRPKWEGAWSELYDEITDESMPRTDGWPANAQKLSTMVRELAQALRGVGIAVEFHDKERPRRIALERQELGSVDEPLASKPETLAGGGPKNRLIGPTRAASSSPRRGLCVDCSRCGWHRLLPSHPSHR